MTIPKRFNKMNREEQEKWLVLKLIEVHEQESNLRRMLATVRGGRKVELIMEERPDEIGMKDPA
jgi:hypothetical protein